MAPWHVPLGLEPQPEGGGFQLSLVHNQAAAQKAVLPEMVPDTGKIDGGVHFSNKGLFLTAKPDGALELSAKEPRHWEQFLPLRPRDTLMLREILAHLWVVDGQSPVPAGLDGFHLRLGPHVAKLSAILPFPPEASHRHLELAASRGTMQATSVPKEQSSKQVWIRPLGNIGNRALQYLTAAGIAARAPGAKVTNVHLEIWGRHEPAPRPEAWASAAGGVGSHLDVEGLGDCLARGEVEAICIEWYHFHLEHYPPRNTCRVLLPAASGTETVKGYGPDELVCSIRADEILRRAHPDYFPLPPAYYAKLQEESGLDLVFYGQLGDDPYSAALRAAFPQARFVPGVNQAHDFEVLRRSRNVAISISTFAWLAAWLGEAERVYLPVGGMFNPAQHPGQLYLPLDEPSFRYVLLPPVTSVNLYENPARFWFMQDVIARQARFANVEELRGLVARAARMGDGKVRVKNFDSAAYLAANPVVANEVRALRCTALGHYLSEGAKENRMARSFDPLFYAASYPDAGEAVALGYYPSLFAHFQETGEAQGYAPVP